MWDDITYPFPNFNSTTVEVWEWISKFHHTLYWACAYLSMLGFKLNHVSKTAPGCRCYQTFLHPVGEPDNISNGRQNLMEPCNTLKLDNYIIHVQSILWVNWSWFCSGVVKLGFNQISWCICLKCMTGSVLFFQSWLFSGCEHCLTYRLNCCGLQMVWFCHTKFCMKKFYANCLLGVYF